MLAYVTGDLFESPAQTLVNTVNTVGVMGKGIALTFKKVYPEMFREYQALCESGRFGIGSLFLYRTPHKLVLNFPTKQHWRKPSRPEYVTAGLQRFVSIYREAGIHSVAFPPLGCGNGELDFASVVMPIMEQYLKPLPIPVYVYAPHPQTEKPEHRTPDEIREWLRMEPRALPFREVWSDLVDLLARRQTFYTLAKETPFTAEFVAQENRVRIRAHGKVSSFSEEEIQELWREFRSHKVLTARSYPKRERDVAYLLAILAKLPYVDEIKLGDTFESFTFTPSVGVQLVPVPDRRGLAEQEIALVG
jgi:O-acetyl-ADP-ribose deacetylase (regulator of RNase III)